MRRAPEPGIPKASELQEVHSFTESQSPRRVWVGRDLGDVLIPPPKTCLRTAQAVASTQPKIPMRKSNPPSLMYFRSPPILQNFQTQNFQIRINANISQTFVSTQKFDLSCHHPSSPPGDFFFLLFNDFRKLLALSGRIGIFWWHLKNSPKITKQKSQVSVLVVTEVLNQIHAQEYHKSLCRDKYSEFFAAGFLL